MRLRMMEEQVLLAVEEDLILWQNGHLMVAPSPEQFDHPEFAQVWRYLPTHTLTKIYETMVAENFIKHRLPVYMGIHGTWYRSKLTKYGEEYLQTYTFEPIVVSKWHRTAWDEIEQLYFGAP